MTTTGRAIFLSVLGTLSGSFGETMAADFADVITVAEARARLARRDFAEPLRVRGYVTFADLHLRLAYVQDGSGGIGFDPGTDAMKGVQPGSMIEVEGVLARRHGAAVIAADHQLLGPPKVQLLPPSGAKVRATRFDLDDAAQMRIDGLLARVSGVIRRVVLPATKGEPMLVEVSTPSGHALARLPWREDAETYRRWWNAPVTFEAVLISRAEPPLLPETADALLLVPGRSGWNVQPEALKEVFSRPAVTEVSTIQVPPRSPVRQRTLVQGTVTAAKRREWLTMRTQDGSVEVTTRQTNTFAPGEVVAVAGWLHNRNGRLMLLDGVCRSVATGSPPQPVTLEEGTAPTALQRELVETQGVVRNYSLPGASPRLVLSLSTGQRCLVDWNEFLQASDLRRFSDGSTVRLTGILRGERPASQDEQIASFAIVPRSADDIHLIRGPTWWTRDRLKVAVWWLVFAAGIALPGAAVFRWQVWRQAQHIQKFESRAATEEERKRIAREFHDSLQQQLAGAALHLETVKGALQAAPEMLPRLLDDTTAMIRHCQAEARHCIWDLRNEVAVHEGLAAAMEAWLAMRAGEVPAVSLMFSHEGRCDSLAEGVPLHVLRICQEAVNNALAHASARHVKVCICGSGDGMTVTIEDDGTGFDIGMLQQPKPGHFGFNSLRERATKIGASLQICSNASLGTTVTLRLPNSRASHESAN